jgi:DNA repair protein RecO (recombination protein O)
LLVSFGGRGELKQLNAVEAAPGACNLAAERLFSGLYLNELLVRLLQRQDPQPALFASYGETLATLAAAVDVDASLRRFEFTLLEALGYHFDLALDGHNGAPVVASGWYRYQPETGLVACQPGSAAPVGLFAGSDLLAIAAGQYGGAQANACKRLLRQALASHLGERPLHSRELFRQFRDRSSAR